MQQPSSNSKVPYVVGGLAILALGYVYLKSKSSSSSGGTTTTPEIIGNPGTTMPNSSGTSSFSPGVSQYPTLNISQIPGSIGSNLPASAPLPWINLPAEPAVT